MCPTQSLFAGSPGVSFDWCLCQSLADSVRVRFCQCLSRFSTACGHVHAVQHCCLGSVAGSPGVCSSTLSLLVVVGSPAVRSGECLWRFGRLGRFPGLASLPSSLALSGATAGELRQGREGAGGEGGQVAHVTPAVKVTRLLQARAVGAVLRPRWRHVRGRFRGGGGHGDVHADLLLHGQRGRDGSVAGSGALQVGRAGAARSAAAAAGRPGAVLARGGPGAAAAAAPADHAQQLGARGAAAAGRGQLGAGRPTLGLLQLGRFRPGLGPAVEQGRRGRAGHFSVERRVQCGACRRRWSVPVGRGWFGAVRYGVVRLAETRTGGTWELRVRLCVWSWEFRTRSCVSVRLGAMAGTDWTAARRRIVWLSRHTPLVRHTFRCLHLPSAATALSTAVKRQSALRFQLDFAAHRVRFQGRLRFQHFLLCAILRQGTGELVPLRCRQSVGRGLGSGRDQRVATGQRWRRRGTVQQRGRWGADLGFLL